RLGHGQFLLVVNASNRESVYVWLKEREPRGTEVRDASDEYGLLAVQGPQSLERLGLDERPAFTHALSDVDGIEVMVCRTGYTGEKGVELCCAEDDAVALWDALLARGATPCGLGARDTLRLEVCYPLHGNDITPERTPIEAGLGWACSLAKDFPGVERLRRQKDEGPAEKLVAFVMEDAGIPRTGMRIEEGGTVTSGTLSPTLGSSIGLAYVSARRSEAGTELTVDLRGRPRRARIVPKPFYKREER
ncbi:MAG: glycine cleavage T C-terminal barrel domain-containing protein, partial [Gaiellaceae bacterium]